MSPSPGDLVGRSLGHFRVVARVGVGGMGIVYKAFDERLHRTIALKLLPDEAIREESHRRRFLREARSAAAVSHPNVAAVHDVGEADGHVFLAMEFIEGRTLREEIARGRLDLAECTRIARGIARALAKAHEKGVVHRDLKPDNVMLNEDREVKVLDFGLAKLLEPEAESRKKLEVDETELFVTAEKQIVGTPSYMSPEQATGKKLDARADLFSFGILLYEMVTGKRPFRGDTPVEVLVAIVHDAPASVSSLNPRISPPFERIIDRCLLKRAEDRFGSARDLVMALEALEAGRASAADLLPDVGADAAGDEPRREHHEAVAGAAGEGGVSRGMEALRAVDRGDRRAARRRRARHVPAGADRRGGERGRRGRRDRRAARAAARRREDGERRGEADA